MFTSEELHFLNSQGIAHLKDIDGTPIGVREFMYTHAIITGYEPLIQGAAYYHRFCYPKNKFAATEVIIKAFEWDMKSLPPEGWVVYKGRWGEVRPYETEKVQNLQRLFEG